MKTKLMLPGMLAAAIAASISVTANAAPANLVVKKDVASSPAQSSSDPVRRFIVNYKEGSQARNNSTVAVQGINQALSRSGLSAQALGGGNVSHVRKMATGHDLFRLPASVDRATANAILSQIAASPDVAFVEIDERVRIMDFPDDPPNDFLYGGYQWHLKAADGNIENLDEIANVGGANVVAAWASALGDGTGIIAAVLDTGIVEHVDIDTSLADAGYDFITNVGMSGRDTDGRAAGGWDLGDWTIGYPGAEDCPQDWSSWHGTHVAGTIGAELTNNEIGVAGIAYNVKVLPVRVLGHCGGTYADIADAIVWASGGDVPGVPANQNPAHIINMSLGGGGSCAASSAVGSAITEAISRGTAVVVSAGNSNGNAANYTPASCPGAISVGATGINGGKAGYSNWGQRVNISAPGGGGGSNWTGYVVQATNSGLTTPIPINEEEDIYPGGLYAGKAGTSMAAPHVAGVIALMQSARLKANLPLLSPDEALTIMQQTVTPFGVTPPSDQPMGAGIVNAAAALQLAACDDDDCTPEPPPPPAATPIFNRVPVTGLSGSVGSETTFALEVPANVRGPVSIISNGGRGDVALYARYGQEPTVDAYDARSARRGNNETVRFTQPQAGTYYIMLRGEPGSYNNVTLRAVFNLAPQ